MVDVYSCLWRGTPETTAPNCRNTGTCESFACVQLLHALTFHGSTIY